MKKFGLKIQKAGSGALPLIVGLVFTSQVCVLAQSAAVTEKNRRRDNIIAAEEQILLGDDAYKASKFNEAVTAYRSAYAQVPAGTETATFRAAARERYAQAAVEAARVMNRQGDREGAIALVDEVLGSAVAPDYHPARELRSKLDDPIRTNPSITPAHAQKVDEVRRILYNAEGAYNLGDFDQSVRLYESVIRLDPYNKAARRGMERNNAAKSDYANAAYDQTRSQMLADVAEGWELKVDAPSPNLDFVANDGLVELSGSESIDSKLDNIIFQQIDFDDISLSEALDFLNARSIALDDEISGGKKGIDFVLNTGTGDSPEIAEILAKTFDLRLRNVSLRTVLGYVTRLSSTGFTVDAFAVKVSPLSGITNELVVRKYQVPPTFLSQSSGANGSVVSDPFGGGGSNQATLAPRLTARQFLEQQGVNMPEGATASYLPASNTLTVKTTQSGQDLVAAIIDALNSKEPIAVIIETRIVNVSQTNLEEIGFDTSITNLAANGEFQFGGGTQGSGNPSQLTTGDPISSGLRSGDFAFDQGDAIESRLELDSVSPLAGGGGTTTFQGAPGVLSVVGSVGDYGLGVLFKGLDQKRGTDIVSKPSVIVRSGEQAVIESVQELIYPTEYEPPELPNSVGVVDIAIGIAPFPGGDGGTGGASFPVTPSHPTAFETRGIGTFLEVMPEVSADRKIIALRINPRIDEFLGFINYGSPITSGGTIVSSNEILMPIFSQISAETTVEIANNSTILIGGLLSENVTLVEDKVPILGNLPFVGKLFTSEGLEREKDVIMIFVTVRLVDPGGQPIQN